MVHRDGPGASGYPVAFSGESAIHIRWWVSPRLSGYPRIPAI
jgi:hypothetical protein